MSFRVLYQSPSLRIAPSSYIHREQMTRGRHSPAHWSTVDDTQLGENYLDRGLIIFSFGLNFLHVGGKNFILK